MEFEFDEDIDFTTISEKRKQKTKENNEDSEFACETNFIKIKHKVKSHDVFYSNAETLAEEIDIKKNDSIFINLSGEFIFGDFIGAFIQKNNLTIVDLTIVSLSGNIDNFEMIDELINKGWVLKCKLILSEYFFRTEKKKHTKTITFLEDVGKTHGDKLNCYYINTHAKIILMKTDLGGCIVMSGSPNLRSSQSIEQLIIEENKELYESQRIFINSLIS